jgi:hypothetical protein
MMHEHFIFEGKCKKSLKEMKNMVIEKVLCMPNATSSTISLAVSTTFLSCHFFDEDGEVPMELQKYGKLNQAMLMFFPLCFPDFHNLISSIKHCSKNMGSFDSILVFKYLPSWIDKVTCVVGPKCEHTQFIFLSKPNFL